MDTTSLQIFSHIKQNPKDIGAYHDLIAWLRHLSTSNTPDLECGRELRRHIAHELRHQSHQIEVVSCLGETLRDCLTIDGRHDFDCFMQAMEFDRTPEERYWLPRRNHLMRLCKGIQWLEDDPNAESLSISLPPRTGKSTMGGLAMTWHIGRYPLDSNLMTGYSDKLTKHFYVQGLDFVTNDEYRFNEIFPDSPFVWKSAEDEAFSLRKHKSYPTLTCRSIEGTLTGAVEVGEHGWLYSDDLVADLEEAKSPNRLNNKFEAYINQAYDRRKKGAKQLMVGTRWDVNDPIGRMYDMHAGNEGYRSINIPALDPKTGESNFDYLYNVGFDRKYYLDMKAATDEATWCAKYEAKPFVREGQLYDADSLNRYLTLPTEEPEEVVAVVDTKDKGVDYCVMPIAKRWNDKWYITDVICDNSLPEIIEERLIMKIEQEGVQLVRFESNSAGGMIAKNVAEKLQQRNINCCVTTKYTSSNKETRILQSSPWVKSKCLFRDESAYKMGSDYGIFMNQMMTYVLEGKNAHDDAPDSMSMLSDFLTKRVKAKATAVARPF